MRRGLAIVLGSLCAGAAVGCGSGDAPSTPSACLGSAEAYLAALESAPGEALLEGTTPIGACLVEEQESGALATVGKAVVDAASELNAEARERPGGQATVELGYLVGAVQEAASSTGGIHEDLVIRLDAAARYEGRDDQTLGADFERAFGEGYAAAQAAG